MAPDEFAMTDQWSRRPLAVQMQMERARQRGDLAEWHRLARSNEARKMVR